MPINCLVWSCPSNGNMEGISFHRDPVPTDASLQRIDGNLSSSDSGSHPKPLITSSSDSAGLKGVQKRNRKLVRTFHTYASSPDMFKTRYMNERTKYHQLRYKHQLEKEKNRRLRNKVSHLKEVVNDIRRKYLLSPNA
ncbi:hypothetical protein JTB14_003748 [Gonioctena quinquepunctata]|nr:hypothetical protein JTB14_003748 [Gonioctena quinquepunctata]